MSRTSVIYVISHKNLNKLYINRVLKYIVMNIFMIVYNYIILFIE